jgi:predicted nucleic acid-binding protein
MLYLDSSALVKVYFNEVGTKAVIARTKDPEQGVCTSVLAFAEVQSALARRYRERLLTLKELAKGRELLKRDWFNLLNVIELNLETMAALPNLVERFPIKAADAIHLSTAIWLNRTIQSENLLYEGKVLEFGVADRDLANIAKNCGLLIFNPEDQD